MNLLFFVSFILLVFWLNGCISFLGQGAKSCDWPRREKYSLEAFLPYLVGGKASDWSTSFKWFGSGKFLGFVGISSIVWRNSLSSESFIWFWIDGLPEFVGMWILVLVRGYFQASLNKGVLWCLWFVALGGSNGIPRLVRELFPVALGFL